jgi:YjbE family integral membrane protein
VGSLGHYLDPSAWGAMFVADWQLMMQPAFWISVGKIIWINILLSGDNAVVIAMACRGLPVRQRLWGMVLGAGVAVVLRIIFTVIVASLMMMPYLKLIGGLALFYIAVKLLVPEDEEHGEIEAVEHLWRAVRIVAVADIIMSLDNVIAIAAAAQGSFFLLILGLAISIPLIVAGAALVMTLLDRFPILVWAGAALLGWIVGEVIATDRAVVGLIVDRFGEPAAHPIEIASATCGAVAVVVVGGFWRRSKFAANQRAKLARSASKLPVA